MANVGSLREHLVTELNDLLNAEQQLIKALPKMVDQATSAQLKAAFRNHLGQTRMHERRATQALKALGEKASGETCEAMKGLLEEGEDLMSSSDEGALLDAMMITAAQKVEHYEIASYGTARTYARVLAERDVARLLEQTLKEEKAADKKLTSIAEGSINKKAAREWHEQSRTSGMLDKGAYWMGSTVGRAVGRVMPRASASDRKSTRRSNAPASRSKGRRGGARSRSRR
jgi:ferritin-like metal-binding protein YciE